MANDRKEETTIFVTIQVSSYEAALLQAFRDLDGEAALLRRALDHATPEAIERDLHLDARAENDKRRLAEAATRAKGVEACRSRVKLRTDIVRALVAPGFPQAYRYFFPEDPLPEERRVPAEV